MKDDELGSGKLVPLMIKMAIPSIIAQTINVLYSIIDRIYIGHIPGVGSSALTGVGLTLPIITLISAFSAFVGAGGAPLAAIFLGKGDKKRAEEILGNGVTMLLVFTVILMAVFYLWQEPFLYAFGASDVTIVYAKKYLSCYLLGTVMVELALGLNPFIICQGRARLGMATVLIGAILNLILDPVFIFVFDLGVVGAAIATIISQTVSAAWMLSFLCGKNTAIRIRTKLLKPDLKTMGRICSLGISPFIMRSTESLISIVMNRGLQLYGGDLYVGSLTIIQSIYQFICAPLGGFTQGVQPVISYNFGAGKFDRVKKASQIMIAVTFFYGMITSGVVMLFPQTFAGAFSSDPEMISLVTKSIRIFMIGMLIFGLQQGVQPSFLALGQAKVSLFIAMLRKVILLVPLALILPHFMGVWGVFVAEPVSDIVSALTAGVLYLIMMPKILTKEAVDKIQ